MRKYIRNILTNMLLLTVLTIMFILLACNSQTFSPSNSETQYPTTVNTTWPSKTHKPTGVEGSDLLPENAPNVNHFIGGGNCFRCHSTPPKHEGEVLNQFGCDRCHIQTSTLMPEMEAHD